MKKNERISRRFTGAALALTVLAAAALTAGCGASAQPSTAAAETTTAAAETTTAAEETTAAPEPTAAAAETTAAAKPESAAGTHIVTDHAGVDVEVPDEINRIVVGDTYPLASVLCEYLGSEEKIVGIHPVSMSAAKEGILADVYPGILNAATEFVGEGAGMQSGQINVEEIMNLDPDVVIGVGEQEAEALRNAGIPAVTVAATKWGCDLLETYKQWNMIFDEIFQTKSETAQAVEAKSQEVLNSVQEATADLKDGEKQKVLVLFRYTDAAMICSGNKFFGQKWCDMVNAVNVAESTDGAAVPISMEQVYEWDPDVVIITNFSGTQPEDLYNNAIGSDDWSEISAVKNKRVYKMPLGLYRSYTPGADTPMTIQWLAGVVYPEIFKDVDINQFAKDYYKEIFGVDLTDEKVEAIFHPTRSAADGMN